MPAISAVAAKRELGLPVLQVEIAGENRLPIAHDVNVGRSTSAGREDFQFHPFAGFDNGSVDPQQDLVGALPRLQRNICCHASAAMIISIHAERRADVAGNQVNGGDTAAVGGDVLIVLTRNVDRESSGCRCAVGIGT